MPEPGRILIDDLEGTPLAADPPRPVSSAAGDREDRLSRYNMPPAQPEFADDDPLSASYIRTDIDETAGSILHFWFGYSADRASAVGDRGKLWFGGGFEVDKLIANRFSSVVARLASGEAQRWAAQGPLHRLAAVVALDQFSRSIFRGTPAAFENDPIALRLSKEGIASGDELALKPVERWFLYMPLEHSESSTDQRRSVEKFAALLAEATPELQPHLASAYDYAKRHAKVIARFGRFPHRNEILGRITTSAEHKFLKQPGSRF